MLRNMHLKVLKMAIFHFPISVQSKEKKKPRLSHSQPVSRLILCLLLNLFSNASDALRAARADVRHYVPLSLNRLGRVINTHGDILVSNAKRSLAFEDQ